MHVWKCSIICNLWMLDDMCQQQSHSNANMCRLIYLEMHILRRSKITFSGNASSWQWYLTCQRCPGFKLRSAYEPAPRVTTGAPSNRVSKSHYIRFLQERMRKRERLLQKDFLSYSLGGSCSILCVCDRFSFQFIQKKSYFSTPGPLLAVWSKTMRLSRYSEW